MWRKTAIALAVMLVHGLSLADNRVLAITNEQETVRIELEKPLTGDITNFAVQAGNKVVIDLDDTTSGVARKTKINKGSIIAVDTIVVDDRARIVINLIRDSKYKINVDGTFISIVLESSAPVAELTPVKPLNELIQSARDILQSGNNLTDAIEPLNAILLLPPNEYSEEAQEQIGLLYEQMAQYDKAKAEYKLFLALFPNSTRYTKVKERLITLEISEPQRKTNIATERKPKLGKDKRVETSIAEYVVVGGVQQDDGPFVTDQQSLISNIRADALFREDQYELKLAYRQSRIDNFLNRSSSKDVLTLGYAEVKDTFKDRSVKVGRQNGLHGAIGRFDGVMSEIGLDNTSRIFVLHGVPFVGQTNTDRKFYGFGYENILTDNWDGEFYVNYQIADGIPERSALGTTVRYYRPELSVTSTIEYDTIYQAVNSFTLHSNATLDPYGLYFLFDKRKSPMLFAERSLMIGLNTASKVPYSSVGEAFSSSGLSQSDVYRFINSSTATSTAFVLGVTKQISSMWNLGVDYQVSSMSSAEDITFVPTVDNPYSLIQQPATAETHSLNFHALGTDVLSKGHTVNALVMLSHDDSSNSYIITLLNGIQLSKIRLDALLMYYNRVQQLTTTESTSVSLRSNYRLTNSAIESQIMLTNSKTTDNATSSVMKSLSASFVLGWKIDF
jgi:tetratricopeptide (TPR) repeat protein